ncbi:hypothetical protein O1611_g7941 [Lasiodiplodia mahajangana]|uniref:Uncharacterized protein n=1 Tax=Lasiodiplodia mahajangana TaxID=1108764 RepID=A0ACC2JEH4_9PEZI|nr:hypothetical protein O1611_g7941 [Lasiodiplodia mahajangana]
MEPIIEQPQPDARDGSWLEPVRNPGEVPDQTTAVNPSGELTVHNALCDKDPFWPASLEMPQQSLDFHFDPSTLGHMLMNVPPLLSLDQFHLPHLPAYINTCPQGHNHTSWPKTGLVVIEKCERRCQFCGLVLGTAASLRKASEQHVNDHKKKDGLGIEVARSGSGRQRRPLLMENDSTLWQPTLFPTQARRGWAAADIQDLVMGVSEGSPKDLDEALDLIRRLRQQIFQLQDENESLKTKIEALKEENGRQGSSSYTSGSISVPGKDVSDDIVENHQSTNRRPSHVSEGPSNYRCLYFPSAFHGTTTQPTAYLTITRPTARSIVDLDMSKLLSSVTISAGGTGSKDRVIQTLSKI